MNSFNSMLKRLSFHSPSYRIRLLTYMLALSVGMMSLLGLDCSSGSENDEEDSSPELSLTIQSVINFHFTWPDVSYETAYVLLENPDGVSGYSEIATMAVNTSSYDHSVSLPDRVNASYILQACDFGGCTDSNTVFVSDTLSGIGYFKASNTDESDLFGTSIALSEDANTLAVGAIFEHSNAIGVKQPADADYVSSQANNSLLSSGAVYVFTRIDLLWQQQAYIKSINNEAFDLFGDSVALSSNGNTLAVSAPGEDGNALLGMNDNSAPGSGAVYIFSRNEEVWTADFYVKASNAEEGDRFGSSIALSSDGLTLAVGAKFEDSGDIGNPNNNSITDSGAAYVFVNDASFWYQQAYLKAPLIDLNDQLGESIALSYNGDTLAVSSTFENSNGLNPNDNSAPNSGAVYVFTRTGVNWDGQHYLKASNTDEGDLFGSALALSSDGRTLAVGAPWEDSNGSDPSDNSITDSGAVYIFTSDGISWQQRSYLKATNIDAHDQLGRSLDLSGEAPFTLAVGASLEDSKSLGIGGDQSDNSLSNSGAVYIYKGFQDLLIPYAYLKAPNPDEEDRFGASIALSNNGDTLVVGAFKESSSATGIGGDPFDNVKTSSGAVYMY